MVYDWQICPTVLCNSERCYSGVAGDQTRRASSFYTKYTFQDSLLLILSCVNTLVSQMLRSSCLTLADIEYQIIRIHSTIIIVLLHGNS